MARTIVQLLIIGKAFRSKNIHTASISNQDHQDLCQILSANVSRSVRLLEAQLVLHTSRGRSKEKRWETTEFREQLILVHIIKNHEP